VAGRPQRDHPAMKTWHIEIAQLRALRAARKARALKARRINRTAALP